MELSLFSTPAMPPRSSRHRSRFLPRRSGFIVLTGGLVLAGLTTLIGLLAAPVTGKRAAADDGKRLAKGITLYQVKHRASTMRALRIDLAEPGVRVEIAAEDIAFREGRITGRAHSIPDWIARKGATAGINGGFFGESVGKEFKEIVGLCKIEGKVRSAGPTFRSKRTGKSYVHSAFGLTRETEARIGWVNSVKGSPQSLRSHSAPEISGRGEEWSVWQAIGCGPRLVSDEKADVAALRERLMSTGELPRTFLGIGGEGKRRRLVLAIADGAEFDTCAAFMLDFFRTRCGVPCRAAMALDGGASTAMAWREGKTVDVSPPLSATVPTAILVYGR
jgi:exopolysaccharide biosynthesis protein